MSTDAHGAPTASSRPSFQRRWRCRRRLKRSPPDLVRRAAVHLLYPAGAPGPAVRGGRRQRRPLRPRGRRAARHLRSHRHPRPSGLAQPRRDDRACAPLRRQGAGPDPRHPGLALELPEPPRPPGHDLRTARPEGVGPPRRRGRRPREGRDRPLGDPQRARRHLGVHGQRRGLRADAERRLRRDQGRRARGPGRLRRRRAPARPWLDRSRAGDPRRRRGPQVRYRCRPPAAAAAQHRSGAGAMAGRLAAAARPPRLPWADLGD